ncbi:M20 family peptidase [Falsiruegeria mediterranea]|uniref:Succinyl-diaminopimelate desuccinylase n=1 Tax=Falsiruegeria mediterranea M17 TaxID=1200281 RepID=A0A2R8C2A8_9RHOB|nr:M20 family peptidase [Falsiruegeria mediterranea]SPJ26564.1 Succinyl-diaminopimelate desuccinylase [Falsiruegeria mediterranea M17]
MLKWVKRIAAVLGVAIVVLAGVLLFNTFRYGPPPIPASDPIAVEVDVNRATAQLSRAIQFKTVSTKPDHPDFDAFLSFLETTYPAVHGVTERVVLDQKTPLYRWQGSNPDLKPVLLAAHYDVVPVAPWNLDKWVHEPYSGTIADGFVWGRGTLDNKGALIAMLSAAESMITAGFTPERTIYFSFGGDEEVGGKGAISVAKHLKEQGVLLEWSLDEGSFVLDKIIPGLSEPVASINLSEKGYVTVTLIARAEGGHSSMPPRVTAVGRLARAVDRVQTNPMPGGLTGVSAEFFDALGRHFSFGQRVVFANRWLFDPLLENILSGAPSTDAMLRTTTAPTMLSGSTKENVLATEARAVINFRIHPRDNIDSVVEHVRTVIDDDEIEIVADRDNGGDASPVSSSTAPGYLDVEASIRAVFGPLAAVPGLTIAATDARHYAKASEDTYRINPFMITGDDLVRFHGLNERLSIENLERGIGFYLALIQKQ